MISYKNIVQEICDNETFSDDEIVVSYETARENDSFTHAPSWTCTLSITYNRYTTGLNYQRKKITIGSLSKKTKREAEQEAAKRFINANYPDIDLSLYISYKNVLQETLPNHKIIYKSVPTENQGWKCYLTVRSDNNVTNCFTVINDKGRKIFAEQDAAKQAVEFFTDQLV